MNLLLKRMTARELAQYAGEEGELVIDLTNREIVLMDGETLGGFPQLGQNRPSVKSGVGVNRHLHVVNGTLVDSEGQPIREIGLTMSGLTEIALTERNVEGSADFLEVIREYARQGYRYTRIAMIPSWWSGTIENYEQNQLRYWKTMAMILDEMAAHGVGTFVDTVHEMQAPIDWLYNYGGVTDITYRDYLDPNSELVQWFKGKQQEFMDIFGDHPAVAGFGIVNEPDMHWLWYNAPKVNTEFNTRPASAWVKENEMMTLAEWGQAMSILAPLWRDIDPYNRVITTNSGGFFNNESVKGLRYFTTMLTDITSPHPAIDLISTHEYPWHASDWSDFTDFLIYVRKACEERGKCYAITEYAINDYHTHLAEQGNTYEQQMRMLLQAVIDSGTQLALAWEWGSVYNTEQPGDYWQYRDGVDGSETAVDAGAFSFGRYTGATASGNIEMTRIMAEYAVRHRGEDHVPASEVNFPEYSGTHPTGTLIVPQNGIKIQFDLSSVERADGMSYGFWFKTPADVTTLHNMTLFDKSNMEQWGWRDQGIWTRFNYNGPVSYFQYPPADGTSYSSSLSSIPLYATGYNTRVPNQGDAERDYHLSFYKPDTWYYFHIQKDNNDDAVWQQTFCNAKMTIATDRPTSTSSTYNWTAASVPLTLGNHGSITSDALRNCEIGEFSIYNRTLTETEVRNKFYNNITPAGTLSARWSWGDAGLVDSVGSITGVEVGNYVGNATFGNGMTPPDEPLV